MTTDQKQTEGRPIERRALAPEIAQLRLERRENDKPVITGYAAVFYRKGDAQTEYQMWPDLVERIMPGAFDAAIKENDDARGLFNHDRNQLLGLRSSGTLRLSVDKVGLKYEIDAPDTQAGRDTVTLLERGDIPGSSFSFLAGGSYAKRGKVVWVTETVDGQTVDIREVHELELFDVGPVTWPAYEGTSAGIRSCSEREAKAVCQEREAWRKQLEAEQLPTDDDVMVRSRLAQLTIDDMLFPSDN